MRLSHLRLPGMPAVPAAVHRLVASKKAPVEPAEPVIFKPSLSCGYGCGTAAGTFGIIPFQEFLSVVDGRLLLQHNMYFPTVQAANAGSVKKFVSLEENDSFLVRITI